MSPPASPVASSEACNSGHIATGTPTISNREMSSKPEMSQVTPRPGPPIRDYGRFADVKRGSGMWGGMMGAGMGTGTAELDSGRVEDGKCEDVVGESEEGDENGIENGRRISGGQGRD